MYQITVRSASRTVLMPPPNRMAMWRSAGSATLQSGTGIMLRWAIFFMAG